MYSSEKNPGINWKDIIIKAVFLVLFILLLIWLFKPNLTPFYSNVFRENIKYMQDAAESYYTNEKLPKNIGDTAEMTLRDMINKNLILPFVDENGDECDLDASYVQVKKNKNDYTLKVNLVCPDESNFVEKTLGCYDYCDDCEEEVEEIIEYQYKQASTGTKNTYSCPKGGTLSGTTCIIYKNETYKATATTTSGTYYCPNGGTLSGTTCYISKIDTYKASTSTGAYYCPNGGTLSGTTCYVSDSYSYSASTNYTCPNGGSLSGTTCYLGNTLSTTNASVTGYSCPNGGTLSGTTCYVSGSSYNASIKNYTCNGKTTTSSTCTTTTGGSSYSATAKTGKSYLSGTYTSKPSGYTCSTSTQYVCTSSSNCPGYVKVYTSCYKNTTTYTCPNGGTLNGTTCVIAGTTKTINGTPNYYCPNGGNLSGTKCVTSGSSYAAEKEYGCLYGTLSGTKCISTSTNTYTAKLSRTCPNGGNLSGTKCYIDDSYVYNASKGKDTSYCPKGGTLNGTTCTIDNSYTYTASKSTGNTIYTCPNGGSLNDKTCSISKVSSSYAATKTTKNVTSYKYKWSTEETLEGWERTGETRKAELANK